MQEQLKSTEQEGKFAGVDTSTLLSNVYLTLSNYVHARYPEVMDMYGGDPKRFHVDGMLGTPKDIENLMVLECYIETVANAIRGMVYKFNMAPLFRHWPHG